MVNPQDHLSPSQPSGPWYSRAWMAIWGYLVGCHGFTLTKAARTRVALFLLALMAAASIATWRMLQAFAVLAPQPDSPAWELALQARLVAFRIRTGIGLALGCVLFAWLVFLALDRTRLGKRLWHWSPGMDSERSMAAKTLVAGAAFLTLLATFGLLAAQVLR